MSAGFIWSTERFTDAMTRGGRWQAKNGSNVSIQQPYILNMFQSAQNHRHSRVAGTFFRVLVVALLVLALRAEAHSITLAWTPGTDPVVAGFKIYYGSASRVYTNAVMVGQVSQLTLPGLVAGKKYFFAVTSCDAAGAESGLSAEIDYTVPLPILSNPVFAQAPGIPVSGGTQSPNVASPLVPLTQLESDTVKPSTSVKAATNPSANNTVVAPTASPAAATPPVVSGTNPGSSPVASATVAAKAKMIGPLKAEAAASPDAALVVAKELPNSPRPVGVVEAEKNNPATRVPGAPEATLGETVAARAGEFYAAANAPAKPDEDQFAADESKPLLDAVLKNTLALVADDQPKTATNGRFTVTDYEASAVEIWLTTLQKQISRFDWDRDGKLSADEQARLAATLDAQEQPSPVFAPLMVEAVAALP